MNLEFKKNNGGRSMKKLVFISLLTICFLLLPSAAFGLNTAEVRAKGGEITLMFVGDYGLQLGAEYGITPEIGAYVEMRNNSSKIGAKYEVDSNIALLVGAINKAPFLGANASMALDQYVDIMGGFNLSLANSQLIAMCELGLAFKVVENVDLRGGLLGEVNPNNENARAISFQLGLGITY